MEFENFNGSIPSKLWNAQLLLRSGSSAIGPQVEQGQQPFDEENGFE